jgi:hypothetical protein
MTLVFAAKICPLTKMNITIPLTPKDRIALLEHSYRCLSTKAFPCLYTFDKKGEDYYVSTCGPMKEE